MPSVLQVFLSNMAAGLGVVFNGYILFVFIWNRKIHTANRLLLLHLALVDTIFSLVILLYNTTLGAVLGYSSDSITYDMNPKNFHLAVSTGSSNSRLCEAHGFVWTLLPIVMVWNVCALSCDRYAAISSPLHYSRLVNVRRALYFVATTWILGVALALPPLLDVCPYVFWDARWACTPNCLSSTTLNLWYPITYILLAVGLPVFVILFCNLHMLLISRYHRHSIVTAIYEVTLSAQATVTHQRNPCYLSKFKGRSAFFTIIQVIGSLAVFTVPYYSVFVWEATKGTESNPVLISVSTFFLTCTPPVNAYVYGVKSRVLRQTLKRLLHQHLYQRGAHSNIKRRLSEIFSDPNDRPPLSRRLSAPAEYGRKACALPVESEVVGLQSDKRRMKCPFKRSVSLPFNPPAVCVTRKPDPQAEAEESAANRRSRRPLTRGESAPEDDIVPCEDKETAGAASWRHKRKLYARSSSFPTEQEPSFRTRRKQHLAELLEMDHIKFEFSCVDVEPEEAQSNFNEIT